MPAEKKYDSRGIKWDAFGLENVILISIVWILSMLLFIFIASNCNSNLEIVVIAVTGALITKALLPSFMMVEANIAGTVSHTVAQRYNPVAYWTVESVSGLIYYCLGVILAGFGASNMKDFDWLFLALEVASLFFISLIFIFPADFKSDTLNSEKLGMQPLDWFQTNDNGDYVFLMVFNIESKTSDFLHGLFTGLGSVLGIAAVIVYLALNFSGKWFHYYLIAELVCAVVFAILFLIGRNSDWLGKMGKEFTLFFEIVALYFLLLNLITLSFGAGDLIPSFDW
jgi:hypothetical protein